MHFGNECTLVRMFTSNGHRRIWRGTHMLGVPRILRVIESRPWDTSIAVFGHRGAHFAAAPQVCPTKELRDAIHRPAWCRFNRSAISSSAPVVSFFRSHTVPGPFNTSRGTGSGIARHCLASKTLGHCPQDTGVNNTGVPSTR